MPTPFVAGTGAPDLSAEELDLEFDEASELESVESEPTFSDLGASEAVIAALAVRGVISPFEIQARVIPDAIAGHDVLAKSRTGSGKTLAFAIPIVERLWSPPASSPRRSPRSSRSSPSPRASGSHPSTAASG